MKHSSTKPRRPLVMAMFLGTAIAAMGSSQAVAASEVQPKALNDISRYCTACWRNARLPVDRWGDCTQEVFGRLLERVPATQWPEVFAPEGAERQEFLRAIDTVKKRVQRERPRANYVDTVVADQGETRRLEMNDHREELQQAAQQLLSGRQQQILRLIGEGWEIGDIASELELAAERISDEKYKAIQKLREYFRSRPE